MKESYGGLGLGGVLFVVFLVLKLIGTIDWSWLWITSPLWIPLAIDIIVSVLYVLLKLHKMKETDGEPSKLSQRLKQMKEECEKSR